MIPPRSERPRRVAARGPVLTCLLAIGLLPPPATSVRAASPTLTGIYPAGATRGASVEVSANGSFSPWPVKTWVQGEGVSLEPLKDSGKFKLTVAAGATPGPRFVRVFNAEGISEPRVIVVGVLPEATETEPNDGPKSSAPATTSPIVMNGRLSKSGDVDVFPVRLTKGQTLVAAIRARGLLGSPMDGVLQVVSESGFVLAQKDDDPVSDPTIVFPVPEDGVYLVRAFAFPATPDSAIRFSGGPDYIYRLTLTTGPFVDHARPVAISTTTRPESLELAGWNLDEKTRRIAVPAAIVGGLEEFGILADARFPDAIEPRLTPRRVLLETERATSEHPFPIEPGVEVTGRLDREGEIDAFEISLKKGASQRIQVEGRGLGSPIDPAVRVLGPDGSILNDLDDSGRGERDLDFSVSAKADGRHKILVRDLHGRGGLRFVYHLSAIPPTPDYRLGLPDHRFTLKFPGETEIKVAVNRADGFDRDVTIVAEGLPKEVTAAPVVSKAKEGTAKSVSLRLKSERGVWSGPIRITGKSAETPPRIRLANIKPATLDRTISDAWLTTMEAPPAKKPADAEKTAKKKAEKAK